MKLFIYSYYNNLLDRYERLFTAETDKDIINTITEAASGDTKEAIAMQKLLEHNTLTRIGEINLVDGEIKAVQKTTLPIKITPSRPIDGIEKSAIDAQ